MRPWLIICFVVIPGVVGALTFGGFAASDYAALQRAYAVFAAVRTGDQTAMLVAEATQNIHRLNLFAEGVWSLLSAILAAIGLHALYVKAAK